MSGARQVNTGRLPQQLSPDKKDTGFHIMKNRTLGGDALEMIMRDVLEGLQDFTRQASPAGRKDDSVTGVQKKKKSARIIRFPRRSTTD
jgi:hypothetical protein